MDFNEKKSTSKANNQLLILSEIEKDILFHIKNGKTSSEIAEIRKCATRTVEKHRSNIIKKLGLKTSQNALLVWIMANLELFDT